MDLSNINFHELAKTSGEWLRGSGPESDIVISSRIRLARNLADFPFISRATPQDRAEIEKILRERILASCTSRAEFMACTSTSTRWRRSTASSSSSGT